MPQVDENYQTTPLISLTPEEAEERASAFSCNLSSRINDQIVNFEADHCVKLPLEHPADKREYPFYVDFIAAFRKFAADYISDEEIDMLLLMRTTSKKGRIESLVSRLEHLAICMDNRNTVCKFSQRVWNRLFEDIFDLFQELYRKRTEVSQENKVSSPELKGVIEEQKAEVEDCLGK